MIETHKWIHLLPQHGLKPGMNFFSINLSKPFFFKLPKPGAITTPWGMEVKKYFILLVLLPDPSILCLLSIIPSSWPWSLPTDQHPHQRRIDGVMWRQYWDPFMFLVQLMICLPFMNPLLTRNPEQSLCLVLPIHSCVPTGSLGLTQTRTSKASKPKNSRFLFFPWWGIWSVSTTPLTFRRTFAGCWHFSSICWMGPSREDSSSISLTMCSSLLVAISFSSSSSCEKRTVSCFSRSWCSWLKRVAVFLFSASIWHCNKQMRKKGGRNIKNIVSLCR